MAETRTALTPSMQTETKQRAGLNFQRVSEFYKASASHDATGYRKLYRPQDYVDDEVGPRDGLDTPEGDTHHERCDDDDT